MITRWNILHLPRRKEKRVTALASAVRFGVPLQLVRLWPAKDALDYDNSPEAIRDAAVADGFPEFERSVGNADSPGYSCMIWNICRFLRDLASRDTIEMFMHDGITLRNLEVDFYPDFQWLCDIIGELVDFSRQKDYPFRILGWGHQDNNRMPVHLVSPSSLVVEGAMTNANSFRVYSSVGAASVLERILSHPSQFREGWAIANRIWEWAPGDPQPFGHHWYVPGMFTGITRAMTVDYPSTLFGSDTVEKLKANRFQHTMGALFPEGVR